jgi:hypothetical protein
MKEANKVRIAKIKLEFKDIKQAINAALQNKD